MGKSGGFLTGCGPFIRYRWRFRVPMNDSLRVVRLWNKRLQGAMVCYGPSWMIRVGHDGLGMVLNTIRIKYLLFGGWGDL